jgi:putative transposase
VKKTRFTEEQIISVLREQEGGLKTADVCRKHAISGATLYAWEAKYGGMDVSPARKLKVLEEENGRFKRLLADAMLGNVMLREVKEIIGLGPPLSGRLLSMGGSSSV